MPEFDVNNSPTWAGDCAHAETQNSGSMTPPRTVPLRTADLIINDLIINALLIDDLKVDDLEFDDLKFDDPGITGLGIDRLTYSSCTKSYFSIATATPWSCAVLSTRTTLPAQ